MVTRWTCWLSALLRVWRGFYVLPPCHILRNNIACSILEWRTFRIGYTSSVVLRSRLQVYLLRRLVAISPLWEVHHSKTMYTLPPWEHMQSMDNPVECSVRSRHYSRIPFLPISNNPAITDYHSSPWSVLLNLRSSLSRSWRRRCLSRAFSCIINGEHRGQYLAV